MSVERLSYEKLIEVCNSLKVLEKPYQPYSENSNWIRLAENDEYVYEFNYKSLVSRIIDKKTNQEVWNSIM